MSKIHKYHKSHIATTEANLNEAIAQQSNYVEDICHKEVTEGLGATVRGQRQQNPLHHGLQPEAHRHVILLDHLIRCTHEL